MQSGTSTPRREAPHSHQGARAPLRGDRRWPSHKSRARITICLSSSIKKMARPSRLPLEVFAPDARRRAIVLSMKDLSNVTRAVVPILSPARNRLMPLCLLRAFLRRGPEHLYTQELHGA